MLDQRALVKAIVEPLLNGKHASGGCDLTPEMKKKLFEIAFASTRAIKNHVSMGPVQVGLVCREIGEMCAQLKRNIQPQRDTARIFEAIKGVVAVLGWSLKPDDSSFDDRLMRAIESGHVYGVNKEIRSAVHTP